MKHLILSITALLLLTISSFGQNNVVLNIHHLLGEEAIGTEVEAKNNIDHDFKVERLQYYISEISIIHDGGSETLIEELWVLVDALARSENDVNLVKVDLGTHNISQVEKIKFHIGVDSVHNHLDPASYDSWHPLAPQFPSMHWGWAAGYRFVAFEGKGSRLFNQVFELHGLDDSNYYTTEVEISTSANDGQIVINLDADYERAMEDINVNAGPIVHGTAFEARECLENFRDHVFTPSEITSSTIDQNLIKDLRIFPNPVSDGSIQIKFDHEDNFQMSIKTIDGKELQFWNNVSDGQILDLSKISSGTYLVYLMKEGSFVAVEKLMIK